MTKKFTIRKIVAGAVLAAALALGGGMAAGSDPTPDGTRWDNTDIAASSVGQFGTRW